MKAYTKYGRYLIYLTISVFTLIVLIGVLNWFINPFGIYNSPIIERLNSSKPMIDDYARLFQASNIRSKNPDAVILGSSVAWVGIDPEHPSWSYSQVYNYSINGPHFYEIARYFQHVNNLHQIKQALIMLDFYDFSTERTTGIGFEEDYLSINYDGQPNPLSYLNQMNKTLFTWNSLWCTLKTIYANFSGWQTHYILDNGLWVWLLDEDYDYHQNFVRITKEMIRNHPAGEFQFDESHTDFTSFEAYRKILRFAYQNDIDLRLAMSPTHVYIWEATEADDNWQKFEAWKRIMVSINQEESQLAGKPAFPIWDFSEYNEFTTEEVPPLGDNNSIMQWYIDPLHFTKELGDLVLSRIFNYQTHTQGSLRNFGTLLSVDNIETHLLQIREERYIYKQTHLSNIAEIENIVKEVRKEKGE